MVVFLVSGLWHGAAMTYLIWGGLHGIYQVVGKITMPARKKLRSFLMIREEVFSYRLWQVFVTFVLVNFAWIFFRASSFTNAITLIKNMGYFNPWVLLDGSLYSLGLDAKDLLVAFLGIGVILIVDILARKRELLEVLGRQNLVFRWGLYISAIFAILIFGIYGPGFNAQDFIYLQF